MSAPVEIASIDDPTESTQIEAPLPKRAKTDGAVRREAPREIAPAEVIDGPPKVLPAPPEPKRMGRPTGAKDAQKRKTPVRAKRAVVVVEQPLSTPPTPSLSMPSPRSHIPPPPPAALLPLSMPSPRSLMREAQSMILQAHHGRTESRRAHFQDSVLRCTSDFRL